MAATHRAPKQWPLTKTETINSFESWKHNLQYTLSLDANFSTYLVEGFTWGKKTKAAPLRGFADDGENVPVAQRKTAVLKNATLELLLGQIANYCPVISCNSIVKNSTCLNDIWQAIRLHYGFQTTGGHFLDFDSITLLPDERPEDLYQRLLAFVDDNLLRQGGGITHHGENIAEDEELTPTLENLIVLTWLKLVHPELPRLVKQRYGTELRSRSLASIKPEISQALDSLLDELNDTARSMRTSYQPAKRRNKRPNNNKKCPLCEQVGRPDLSHFLSECPFLPEKDRSYITRTRQIAIGDESDNESDVACALVHESPKPSPLPCLSTHADDQAALRVQIDESPVLDAFYNHHAVSITVDSGSEGNLLFKGRTLLICP